MRKKADVEHRLNHTFRRDRARGDATPLDAEVLCPTHLTPAAQAVWRRTEPALRAAGLLLPIDAGSLALYCGLQTVIDDCLSRGVAPSRDVMSNYRALANSLVMTADARSRLGVGKPVNPVKAPSVFDDI